MNIELYDSEVKDLNEELLKHRSLMSDEIVKCCNRLIKKAHELKDIALEGYARYYIAENYYLKSTDDDKFNKNLLKALKLLKLSEDSEMLARCYNLLGAAALNNGSRELALDFHFTALKHCNELEKSNLSGIVEYNIGRTFFNIGDYKQALRYVNLAEKDIKGNKKDSFYYRNLLLFYCFKADCCLILDDKKTAQECLDGIDRLEEEQNVPADYFEDYPIVDIRMRANYYLGHMDKSIKYSEKIRNLVLHGDVSLDSIEDIIETVRFLIRVGRSDEALKAIEVTEETISKTEIPNVRMNYAKLKHDVFELMGNKEKADEAVREYYDFAMLQQQQSISSYSFFADIRTTMLNVEKENIKLKRQADTDSLTGIGNRFALNRFVEVAFDKAYKSSSTIAVEILDFDNFKHLNDTYGHHAGDEALKKIANEIKKLEKKSPFIHGFRYGGDEFIIIYEKMSDDEIFNHAIKLRQAITNRKILNEIDSKNKYVTISQGLKNGIPSEKTRMWDYLNAADNALYEVKKTKKGEIVLAKR